MADWLTHPVFGDLQWQEKFSWWFTQIFLESGKRLDVIIDPSDGEPTEYVERVSQFYCRVMDSERDILREVIKQRLLFLYDVWRQEGDPELTAEELQDQLNLTCVRIETDSPIITLGYELGDFFGGHTVDVKVNEQLQVK